MKFIPKEMEIGNFIEIWLNFEILSTKSESEGPLGLLIFLKKFVIVAHGNRAADPEAFMYDS